MSFGFRFAVVSVLSVFVGRAAVAQPAEVRRAVPVTDEIPKPALPTASAPSAILAMPPPPKDYRILTLDGRFSPQRPTHLLVVGASDELSDGLFRSAVTRAYYLGAHFADRQVVILLPNEPFGNISEPARSKVAELYRVPGKREDTWIKRSGLKVAATVPSALSRAELVRVASGIRQLKSFEVFAHSSWVSGAAIASKSFVDRFPFVTAVKEAYAPGSPVNLAQLEPGIETLAARFTDDAYAVIWGCNSGWTIAPMLSRLWGVPVLGSLTFADFESLHKDGHYYMKDYGFPSGPEWAGKPWAVTNDGAFPGEDLSCGKACLRMKPNNFPYQGSWGNYSRVREGTPEVIAEGGGLGFMKAFCNFDRGRRVVRPASRRTQAVIESSDQTCYRGLGHFMASSVSTGPASERGFMSYKTRLLDFLCPNDTRDVLYKECLKKLEESEFAQMKGYSSFKGNPIECSLRGCEARFRYLPGVEGAPTNAYGIDQPTVRLDAPRVKPNEAQTQLREYHMYLKAYEVYSGQRAPRLRLYSKLLSDPPDAEKRLPASADDVPSYPRIDD